MFPFDAKDSKSSKCYFTHSVLPAYVDQNQPPCKKKPFSLFLAHPFAHTADLILPDELYQFIQAELDNQATVIRYARVHMKLSEIIEGDFLSKYIKNGNILLISQGRPHIDNIFSLHNGTLRLELDRATYERCGLVGTPIQDGGRKHRKARFAVDINLKLPAMQHGRKGFERVVWAFKNVLNQSVTWLFYDLEGSGEGEPGLIEKYHPIWQTVKPEITRMPDIKVPPLKRTDEILEPENAVEVYEWLSMVSLGSPRIRESDDINSYLSLYRVPDFDPPDEVESGISIGDLVRIRWRGLLPPMLTTRLWLLLRKHVSKEWVALNVTCFRGTAYSALGIGTQEVLTWECEG